MTREIQDTFEFGVKPLPFTINVNSPLCACFVVGSSVVMTSGATTFNCAFFVAVNPQLSVAVKVKSYVPAGPALLTVRMPVVGLTLNVPVKPAVLETAVIVATVPLSVGAALGVKLRELPFTTSRLV